MTVEKKLQRAINAESVGVSSPVIQQMIGDMYSHGVNVHSIMVLRHGKVACEAWSAPLTPEMPHQVFSVSKSVLATAYGFALDEGKIEKTTRFLDVFPELKPKKRDENLEKLTIHHLLTMTSGKKTALKADRNGDWLAQFVKLGWDFAPGESWRYVSENFYAASAMLTRVLDTSVTEYLTPRLFEPLGIDVPFWETSPAGIEAGGWGLMLKTEDMAKFILCYHDGGRFNGEQVIPAWFAKEATSKISSNDHCERNLDCRAGYGCGFWRCGGLQNTYRCEGMFCQYAISFDDYDACLVMTSDHSDLQQTLDIMWHYIPAAFIEPNIDGEGVSISLHSDEVDPAPSARRSIEKSVSGKTYKMRRCRFVNKIGFPVSMLPMPVVFFAKNSGGNMDDIKFDFDEGGFYLSWKEDGDQHNRAYFPLDGSASMNTVSIGDFKLNCRCWAKWETDTVLYLRLRPLEGVAERIIHFEFNGKRIKMHPYSIPGTKEKAEKTGEKLKCILVGRFFHWWIDVLVPQVSNILNPTHYGKMK